MTNAEREAIRDIPRTEPTKEQNEFANRNHPAKQQVFDLQLKDARCGLNMINNRAFMVNAYDNKNNYVFVADFYFDREEHRTYARYLAEQLCNQINNMHYEQSN